MPFINPLPWKLPAPFVGPILKTIAALISLTIIGILYLELRICGRASIGMYATNVLWIILIFVLIAMFCARRLGNFVYDKSISLFALMLTLSWWCLLLLNLVFLAAGVFRCNIIDFQQGDLKYCYLFGNPEVAMQDGWDGKKAPLGYTWMVFVIMFAVIGWQVIQWHLWYDWINVQVEARLARERSSQFFEI